MRENIQKLFYLQLKANYKDRGFITLEVIVALIVGLAFFAVGLQAFGTAMAMKAQSIEKQRANELIQEDIERISQLGSTLAIVTPSPVCNPTGATVADEYNNSLAQGLWDNLILEAPANSANLRKNVVNRVNTTTGAVTNTGGRTLALERSHVSGAAGGSVAPHRTLKIGYRVWYWDDATNTLRNRNNTVRSNTDDPIAETYVEVIPDVALSCP